MAAKKSGKRKSVKKVAKRKSTKKKASKRNPVKKTRSLEESDKYLIILDKFIRETPEIEELMLRRYGPFFNGIIDDMAATYANRPDLKPQYFVEWYINNRIDVENAKEIVRYNGWGDLEFAQEMRELIQRLNRIDKI